MISKNLKMAGSTLSSFVLISLKCFNLCKMVFIVEITSYFHSIYCVSRENIFSVYHSLSKIISVNPPWHLKFSIFSNGSDLTLSLLLIFQVVSGKVVFRYESTLVLRVPHVRVSDGKWHSVEIILNRNFANVTVDFVHKVGVSFKYIVLDYTIKLFIGGKKNSSGVFSGFTGCIQGTSVGGCVKNRQRVCVLFCLKK